MIYLCVKLNISQRWSKFCRVNCDKRFGNDGICTTIVWRSVRECLFIYSFKLKSFLMLEVCFLATAKVSEKGNRNCPPRNTIEQLSTHSAQHLVILCDSMIS